MEHKDKIALLGAQGAALPPDEILDAALQKRAADLVAMRARAEEVTERRREAELSIDAARSAELERLRAAVRNGDETPTFSDEGERQAKSILVGIQAQELAVFQVLAEAERAMVDSLRRNAGGVIANAERRAAMLGEKYDKAIRSVLALRSDYLGAVEQLRTAIETKHVRYVGDQLPFDVWSPPRNDETVGAGVRDVDTATFVRILQADAKRHVRPARPATHDERIVSEQFAEVVGAKQKQPARRVQARL